MKSKYFGSIVFVAALLVIGLVSAVFAQTTSVVADTRWHSDKVSVAYMNERIRTSAEEYKEYAPIPRVAFYDIGYPKDAAEFNELKGYAVLLISALSQSESELPLKRAYVEIDGKTIELKLLKEIYSKQSDLNSQISKTFGQYEVDSIYLFPVYLRKQKANVLIDFAANRDRMQVTKFTDDDSEIVGLLPDSKPSAMPELTEAVKRFLQREYPGFLDN